MQIVEGTLSKIAGPKIGRGKIMKKTPGGSCENGG